jgi:hypothetical protein
MNAQALALLCGAYIFLSPLITNALGQVNPPDIPPNGDWVIDSAVEVVNEKVQMNGNIEIREKGELILRGVTLEMGTAGSEPPKIVINPKGTLKIHNGVVRGFAEMGLLLECGGCCRTRSGAIADS